MKILKLLLFLALVLHAEYKLNIPKSIHIDTLNKIIEHGWNESNNTQKALIVQKGESQLPSFLVLSKNPIQTVNPSLKTPAPSPKILLGRDDYIFILAYCKYLESIHKEKIAVDIYFKILNGLHGIKDKTLISCIFRIVIESTTIKNIENHILQFKTTEKQKKVFHKELSNILITNKELLCISLKNETLLFKKLLTHDLINKVSPKQIDSSLANSIINESYKLLSSSYSNFCQIKTRKELIELVKTNNSKRKKILTSYQKWIQQKNKDTPKTEFVKIVSEYLFTIAHIKVAPLLEDIQDNIKENKRLLEILEKP